MLLSDCDLITQWTNGVLHVRIAGSGTRQLHEWGATDRGNVDLARLGSVLVPAEFLSARPRGTRSVHISDCVPDQFRTEVNLAEHLQWGGDETV
jgi:hypothetical protein